MDISGRLRRIVSRQHGRRRGGGPDGAEVPERGRLARCFCGSERKGRAGRPRSETGEALRRWGFMVFYGGAGLAINGRETPCNTFRGMLHGVAARGGWGFIPFHWVPTPRVSNRATLFAKGCINTEE